MNFVKFQSKFDSYADQRELRTNLSTIYICKEEYRKHTIDGF